MSIAPLEDLETTSITDLETLFEESIPCTDPNHDAPATHTVEHPVHCRLFICDVCAREILRFIEYVFEHMKTCPGPHGKVTCATCNQMFDVKEICVRPIEH